MKYTILKTTNDYEHGDMTVPIEHALNGAVIVRRQVEMNNHLEVGALLIEHRLANDSDKIEFDGDSSELGVWLNDVFTFCVIKD